MMIKKNEKFCPGFSKNDNKYFLFSIFIEIIQEIPGCSADDDEPLDSDRPASTDVRDDDSSDVEIIGEVCYSSSDEEPFDYRPITANGRKRTAVEELEERNAYLETRLKKKDEKLARMEAMGKKWEKIHEQDERDAGIEVLYVSPTTTGVGLRAEVCSD